MNYHGSWNGHPFSPQIRQPRVLPTNRRKPRNPRVRSASEAQISFLREEEIGRLFSAIDSIRDRDIFRLAYLAGLRASEIGMLQIRDGFEVIAGFGAGAAGLDGCVFFGGKGEVAA